jgi:hypothetical protein
MVFNATFNNISEISLVSVLLVEKTRDAEEYHQKKKYLLMKIPVVKCHGMQTIYS